MKLSLLRKGTGVSSAGYLLIYLLIFEILFEDTKTQLQ